MIANLQARFDHRTIRYYLAAFRRGAGVAFALLHRMALDSVMAEPEAELEYKQQFILRVTKSRTASGMKQWQIAEAMGIPQDRYKQYETRSLMPHHLIGRFCIICRVDPEWLVTGRGKKPTGP
jgi:predicted XRE-type DNA-binding protein